MRILPAILFVLTAFCVQAEENTVLFTASEAVLKTLKPQSSTLTFQNGAVLVETKKGDWPGFYLGGQHWNLENTAYLLIEVTNHGNEAITLNCRLDSPLIDNTTMDGTYTHWFSVEPGAAVQGKIPLPVIIPPQFDGKFFAMRGFPGGARGQGNTGKVAAFHKDAVAAMTLFLNRPDKETKWSVRNITAVAETDSQNTGWKKMNAEQFFPMIDEFGQFKHNDWKGKVHSVEELKKNIGIEAADIAAHPGPENIDKYGGYTASEKRKATGHFRTEKVDGKWWFVDPEGNLFWSHGTDCVINGNATTPLTDREFYFEGLPERNNPAYRTCYGKGSWAPHNYYENKGEYDTFNFTQYNLMRKYGDDWKNIHAGLVHKRLRSWGMNTIANWSDRSICEMRKTVYTANMGSGGKPIAGSGGYWGKFPDPFSKEFENSVADNAKKLAASTADDPWCLGYFVDNEISWGGERSLAVAAITSPADQPAKKVFTEDLKKKYSEIGKLNGVWGTKYADWDAVLQTTEKPNEGAAQKDLDEFHRKVCEKYFQTIRDALKKVAPDKLYLGCRFAWVNVTAIYAAAKYCDVISFNKYQRTLADFKLPEGIDLPVIIGEFHFGALDRGMFHTGLVPTESQEKRAEAYYGYVRSAAEHPNIVGTHWFQYGDQATTGRGDGENYQIGLLNVADVPYPETIEAVRRIGYELYKMRKK